MYPLKEVILSKQCPYPSALFVSPHIYPIPQSRELYYPSGVPGQQKRILPQLLWLDCQIVLLELAI